MTAPDFAAWVDHMRSTRQWTKAECARQLGCGRNMIAQWSKKGAPRYIALACAALGHNVPSLAKEPEVWFGWMNSQ